MISLGSLSLNLCKQFSWCGADPPPLWAPSYISAEPRHHRPPLQPSTFYYVSPAHTVQTLLATASSASKLPSPLPRFLISPSSSPPLHGLAAAALRLPMPLQPLAIARSRCYCSPAQCRYRRSPPPAPALCGCRRSLPVLPPTAASAGLCDGGCSLPVLPLLPMLPFSSRVFAGFRGHCSRL